MVLSCCHIYLFTYINTMLNSKMHITTYAGLLSVCFYNLPPNYCQISFVTCNLVLQVFINYIFLCTGFRALKTVLGARPCMWEIVHVKGETCTLFTILWYQGRNCTKLVLKPLAAKNGISISVLCIAPFP